MNINYNKTQTLLPLKKVLYITTILFYTISFGQTKITGKVTDAEDGQPLIGAQIIILPQEKGFITNNTGGFEISGNPEYKSLQVYYLGYVSQTVPISENTSELGTISLLRSNTTLDEVIVSASPNNFKKDFS